jgi:hypothetical protein
MAKYCSKSGASKRKCEERVQSKGKGDGKGSNKEEATRASAEAKNLHWKLVRQYSCPTISFRLCPECSDSIFHDQERTHQKKDGSVQVRFVLCSGCVEKNTDVGDLLDHKRGPFSKEGCERRGASRAEASNKKEYAKVNKKSKQEEEAIESEGEAKSGDENSEDDD